MINKVILLGYVGDEADVRSFEGGSQMARLRIATNEKIHIRKTNEVRQHTEWHNVIFWNEAAKFVDKYIHKGTQVYVEGALRRREWTNKEGVKQIITEIYGTEIKIVSQPTKVETPTATSTPEVVPPKDDVDGIPF